MATHPITEPTTRWRRVEDLFHRASELPAADRTAFLQLACTDDPTLLTEVLELLHADSAVAHKIATPAELFPTPDSWLHRTLGHYTIQHELGRGGMGVVYLGQRTTPGPHQQAAIKVVRRNLQDSPALNHFLLERDALARLEHPNIARLLDGGISPEGIPWLALEYVQGQRLDEYAAALVEAPNPSIHALLRLVLQLCDAVDYVHRNLILHRDLKPGNVMVTAEGVVKLLDFGTLKFLQSGLHESAQSEMTQAGMRPVTLRFASPEHIHNRRVSTASDVYSLGIILYRLLAGRYPEPQTSSIPGAPSPGAPSIAAPSRSGVRNRLTLPAGVGWVGPQSPISPTSRFQSPMAGFFKDLRQDRLAPPSAFTTLPMPRELARDLDAITMKAIRYNPDDRYQTAEALAAELTRALEKRPVQARGQNRAYLIRKFYTRHAVALAAAAAALLVLFAGLLAMAHETRVAHAQQARAEMGVDQERKLAQLLLFDYFNQIEQIPSSTDAQRRTVTQASAYLDQLNQDPALRDPILQLYEVQGYTKLGNVLGNPNSQDLGDPSAAILSLAKAIGLADQLLAAHPTQLPLLTAALQAHQSLLMVHAGVGDIQHAVQAAGPGQVLEARILANPALGKSELFLTGAFEGTLGDLYFREGNYSLHDGPTSISHHLRAIELQRRALALDPGCLPCRLATCNEQMMLGSIQEDRDPFAAGEHYRQGLADIALLPSTEQAKPKTLRLARLLQERLGIAEASTEPIDEGLGLLEQTRRQFRATSQADPIDFQSRFDWFLADSNLTLMLMRLHQYAAAIEAYHEEIALGDLLARANPHNRIWVMRSANARLFLDEALTALHQPAAALEARRQGLPTLLALAHDPTAPVPILLRLAKIFHRLQLDPALELSLAQKAVSQDPNPTGEQWLTLAQAEDRIGDHAATHRAAQQAVSVLFQSTGAYNAHLLIEARKLSAKPL